MVKNIFIFFGLIYWSESCIHYAKAVDYKIVNKEKEKDKDYWYSLAKEDLDFALNRKTVENIAKNVIVFVGDGLGITASTAGRIFKGQKKGFSGEEGHLVWEKFTNAAFVKTYSLDKQVADSAATATAIFSGVKTSNKVLGLNGKVKIGDCKTSLIEENTVHSIIKWSQDSGKDTGLVTTTRVTHATPASLFAHSPHRDWECDSAIKNEANEDATLCKDIALQLIEDDPGRNINVILGGGRNPLGADLSGDERDGCVRNDSRNLVNEWLKQKTLDNKIAKYVTNKNQLDEFDPKSVDYLMGLFAGSHFPYVYERENSSTTPSLKRLTEIAIMRLSRNKNGFFLMVEGGKIDKALHESRPHAAFLEILELEEAVETALEMTNIEDTLIIVTADHSHVITINGYPNRGHDILGLLTDDNRMTDHLPYTTLMFTTGFGANYSWNGEKVVRANLTNVNTRDMHFVFPSAVPTKSGKETHGGEDIGIYAIGPMSHLFHRVHEQSYIAHAMAYSSCIGPFKNNCKRAFQDTQSRREKNSESSAERRNSYGRFILMIPSIFGILKLSENFF